MKAGQIASRREGGGAFLAARVGRRVLLVVGRGHPARVPVLRQVIRETGREGAAFGATLRGP